ncbi:MAG TPA: NUDIX hydrolase, partial [Treponemataceae bacterium]|nr:NUDIX hydrolase [Treponemataceae bacterium]
MKKNTILSWKIKKQKNLIKTSVMTIMEQTTVSPNGNHGTYIVMNAPDWVVVIPKITENKKECFLMVEQWRHGSKELCIEFPGGIVDKGENPKAAAKRELLEETGFKTDSLIHLASMSPNPAVFSNTIHFYTSDTLTNTHEQHLDIDEYI